MRLADFRSGGYAAGMDDDFDVTVCPQCGEKGAYEHRVLIDGRGYYQCPQRHRWQDMHEKPSAKGIPLRQLSNLGTTPTPT